MSYGQYSYASTAGARYTVAEQTPYTAAGKAKRWGHNRVVYTLADGTVAYRLHMTDIVLVKDWPDGTVVININTGGWNTLTTRKAIGEALGLALKARGMDGGVYTTWPKRKSSLPNSLRIFRNNPFEVLAAVEFTNAAVVHIQPDGKVEATAIFY